MSQNSEKNFTYRQENVRVVCSNIEKISVWYFTIIPDFDYFDFLGYTNMQDSLFEELIVENWMCSTSWYFNADSETQ